MEEPNKWCCSPSLYYDEGKRSEVFLFLSSKNETVCVMSRGFFLVGLIS